MTKKSNIKKKVVATAEKMNKSKLVEVLAEKTDLNKKQADEAVSVMLSTIIEALQNGQNVGLPGLGTLSVKPTAARVGVRPGTTERIEIPAGKKVAFKAATTLKSSL